MINYGELLPNDIAWRNFKLGCAGVLIFLVVALVGLGAWMPALVSR